MTARQQIRKDIMAALAAGADSTAATKQQAYMKSEMPYYGVNTPQMRKLSRAIFKAHVLDTPERWEATVLDLWRKAKRREERYAAIELVVYKPYRAWITPDRVPMLDELIVTGAWWDYVDGLAAYAFGTLLARHPASTKKLLRRWAKDDDIWRRRTAILAQLSFKDATDQKLLYDCIEPSVGHPEFFLRKSIGWALRTYSYTQPDAVVAYVKDNESRLAPLSVREALKALKRAHV